MSDSRWTDVDRDIDDALRHFGMALRIFAAGGFDAADLEGYKSSSMFLLEHSISIVSLRFSFGDRVSDRAISLSGSPVTFVDLFLERHARSDELLFYVFAPHRRNVRAVPGLVVFDFPRLMQPSEHVAPVQARIAILGRVQEIGLGHPARRLM